LFYSKCEVFSTPPATSNEESAVPSDEGVFAISVAARMASMEIQNLRVYERRGLVDPDRTPGGTRLYSEADVGRLVRIGELLAEGLNLAGIRRVLELEHLLTRLRAENTRLRTATG
jgi:DNA-binding transcriptional MerR regulator